MLFAKKKSAQTKSGRHNQSQSSEGGGGEKEEEKKTKHAIKQEGRGIEGKEDAAMTLMEKELLQRWAQKATFLKLFCLVLLANRQEG